MADYKIYVDQIGNTTATTVSDSSPLPVSIPPTSTSSNAPTNSTQAALATSKVIKASAGTLFGISGYNSGAAQFIQLHDAAALPADTAVPVVNIAVAATSNFSIDFGLYGMAFANGIVACNSSTAATKTIGGADCQFFARYK